MSIEFGDLSPWLGWPAWFLFLGLFIWLWREAYWFIKEQAFGFVRSRLAVTVPSWIEGLVSLVLGIYLWPLMLVVLPIRWLLRARRNGGSKNQSAAPTLT